MQINKSLHKSRQSVHYYSTKNIYIRNSVGDYYFNIGNARFSEFLYIFSRKNYLYGKGLLDNGSYLLRQYKNRTYLILA